ncbi:hypothetical protein AVEN_16989-1 [Araneus ventricosus]|uniref:Uncharacterized protein n=1 Tax=Araneus ventricosus TaxID=182803 RepID=A0A4Y1ZW49_ARAVE|nr:hypothetical protein AVEN_16989-1 [Araneus ventricosus]
MENEGLFTNMQENTYHREQETIDLAQISDGNRQQFTTLIFSNTNSQQITSNDNDSTFISAQLTNFLARTPDETLKSFQWINTTLSHPNAVLIYSLRQAVTSQSVLSYIQVYFLS